LDGYTDNVGTVNGNLTLSQNRANGVSNYLTTQGIPAGRVTINFFGQNNPIGDNSSLTGQALNRRGELIVHHWTPLTDFFPSLSISSLSIDPTTPDTIYAGTGSFSS